MAIRLAENNYGKSRVRLLRVARQEGRHDIKELTLQIRFEGDFESAHTKGDNLEEVKPILPYYAGRVKCIFIDPPCASLRSDFIHTASEQTHSDRRNPHTMGAALHGDTAQGWSDGR